MSARPRILMVGPDVETKSGLASCMRGYLHSPLAEAFEIVTVSSYEFAGPGRKLRVAAAGLARFARLAADRRVSVVHIHTSGYNSFHRKSAFVLLARLYRKRVLLHMHSSAFHEFYDRARSRAWIRWVLNRADVLIVLSRSWEAFFRPLVSEPIVVVPTAIDTAAPWLPRHRDPEPEILFVGGYWRRKGLFDLIEALPAVRERVPEVKLVLLGFPDDRERREAEALWRARGLEDAVQMLGWVGEAEKARRLARAGVFVLPSYGEGMPMGTLEAMAAGVPVVSTTVGGIPEQVVAGETGFLVAPGDREALAERIVEVLTRPELAARMGAAGQRRAREVFDIRIVTGKVAQLYQET